VRETLFSETSAAAVTCAIISPLSSPGRRARNGRQAREIGFTSSSMRRSEMEAHSQARS
jgi:hypothetical protein